ncbi:hypothetical protein [Sphingosinicella terrae]|uniref:hypothetical protein n=1 Tax=Sphingosinicella terrae TaxID=2172047 RepID=UPI000E0DF211|nr:hypothetical protein [Sphingosinicella terrae]
MGAGVYPADVAIPSLPPARYLLRRIDGRLERAIVPDATGMASRLLEALLTGRDGATVEPVSLPLAVHDRLLALVYCAELGDGVKARARCRSCGDSFELSFSLPDLLASQDEAAAAIGLPGPDGRWTTDSDRRLRPPTLADAGAGAAEDLLARIADGPVAPDEAETLSDFLERASPLLSLDIDTSCPACGERQAVWFDLPRFLLDAIAAERPFLIRETHLVAARYGWSHDEIMALEREERRAFAALIESERSAALRRAS